MEAIRPQNRWFLQEPQDVTSHKTAFFTLSIKYANILVSEQLAVSQQVLSSVELSDAYRSDWGTFGKLPILFLSYTAHLQHIRSQPEKPRVHTVLCILRKRVSQPRTAVSQSLLPALECQEMDQL
jgi:hypothetical protein